MSAVVKLASLEGKVIKNLTYVSLWYGSRVHVTVSFVRLNSLISNSENFTVMSCCYNVGLAKEGAAKRALEGLRSKLVLFYDEPLPNILTNSFLFTQIKLQPIERNVNSLILGYLIKKETNNQIVLYTKNSNHQAVGKELNKKVSLCTTEEDLVISCAVALA